MATRFSLRAAPLVSMLALLGLSAPGCLGQSGNSPTCSEPAHCLCETLFSYRIRGEVLRTDGVSVELVVLDLPDGGGTYSLTVGAVIGGKLHGCETAPTHAVGDEVWVFNYQPGSQSGNECPELKACFARTDDWDQCVESEREACSAHTEVALRSGYLALAVESGGAYDLGEDPTGPGVIAIDHVDIVVDREACNAEFPPPPAAACNDTPGRWY